MAPSLEQAKRRLVEYLERLGKVLGHADRREPFRAYLEGLLLPGERKSVEPMAARIDPRHAESRHQSMHHFVATAPWDAQELIAAARSYALPAFDRHAPVGAWIVDDSGIPKKGSHSVGVARQYCGVLGKQENCQVVVTVSLASEFMSIPLAYRLYLPEAWAKDRKRRRAAKVPDDITFKKKWEIALDEIDRLIADKVPMAPVVADAGYGIVTEFRDSISARGIVYMVGISSEVAVWPPDKEPLPPKEWEGRGRRPKLLRRTADHKPVSVTQLAADLSESAWQEVTWSEGTKGDMTSRFAAVRVRAAHRDNWRHEPRPREWLLIEWPTGEKEPTKLWLSTASDEASLEELVRLAKLRWRIERDYEELKDELGLDHYEGRGWLGFHHHGALCIAAYAFLVAERARLSPPAPLAFLKAPPVPKGFRPRGSPNPTGTT
jgi:SRSO17 transposase